MNNSRLTYHTASVLTNGKVLVTGGSGGSSGGALSSAELYDPSTGTVDNLLGIWITVDDMIIQHLY